MTTVIDLGPVDWGRIWADRSGLVTAEELAQLNAITNATHSQHPGYWRNLFASFPDVVANAGQIARLYVRPGQTPAAFETKQKAKMVEPSSMNKQVADLRAQTIKEVEAERAKPPPHPITQGFIIVGRQIKDEVPGVRKGIEIAEKLGETVGNIVDTAGNLVGAAKHLTDGAKDFTKETEETVQKILLVGGVIAAAYVYSLVK